MSGNATYTASPFNHANANIILRSSSLRYPPTCQREWGSGIRDVNGLAVIPVTEDNKTLDALLHFCHPCTLADDPNIDVLKDATDVLNEVRKYSLDDIEQKDCQVTANPRSSRQSPRDAIAYQGCLWEEMLLAAGFCSKDCVSGRLHPYDDSLQGLILFFIW
jgi:hypothetical protein